MTGQEHLTVANEILRQIGGNKFKVMTGAKDFIGGENFLRFSLPGGGGFTKGGINRVEITLDPDDTYSVKFQKKRGGTVTLVSEFRDIYCDGLEELISNETGLATHF